MRRRLPAGLPDGRTRFTRALAVPACRMQRNESRLRDRQSNRVTNGKEWNMKQAKHVAENVANVIRVCGTHPMNPMLR